MSQPYPSAPVPLRRLLRLALAACLTLTLGACASTATDAGGADAAVTSGDRGVISNTDDMTNRRIRMQVTLADFTETVNMREGQEVRFQQPDATYVLVPRVSKAEVGQIEVRVRRELTGGHVEDATGVFPISIPYEFHVELRNLDWPPLTVEVEEVRPPLRPGM